MSENDQYRHLWYYVFPYQYTGRNHREVKPYSQYAEYAIQKAPHPHTINMPIDKAYKVWATIDPEAAYSLLNSHIWMDKVKSTPTDADIKWMIDVHNKKRDNWINNRPVDYKLPSPTTDGQKKMLPWVTNSDTSRALSDPTNMRKVARDFRPVVVGPAVTDANKMVPLIDHKTNALVGAGVGTAVALLYHMAASAKNRKAPKDKKKSATHRLLKALLWGGASGAATYAAMSIWQNIRGTNFSHEYNIPDLKPGENPDFHIYFSGSNSGPWQNNPKNKLPDGSPMINWDVEGANIQYGENRTAHINGFDKDYAKRYISDIIKKYPNARIRISGHSMGGATAYNMARWAADNNIPIDALYTYDPISRTTKFNGKPSSTRLWVNYRPSEIKPMSSFPDFWAWLGGPHKKLDGSVDVVINNRNINDHRMVRFAPTYYEGEEYSDYPTALMQNLTERNI